MKRPVVGLFVVLSLLSGCATSIVRKPEINGVRRVAIASLFASEDVIYKHGNEKYADWRSTTKDRVAKMAHQAFEEELKKLGWETTPYTKVLASKAYKAEFAPMEAPKDGNVLQKGIALADKVVTSVRNNQYFTLPDMRPINWFEEKKNEGRGLASFDIMSMSVKQEKPMAQKLQAVANDLAVDAVLLVHLDYCYGDGVSVLGNGQAYILGQASMYAVDKHGVEVVNVPPIKQRCETEPYGGKSGHSTAIVNKKLLFGDGLQQDKMVTMFYEATKSTAKSVVTALDVAINK